MFFNPNHDTDVSAEGAEPISAGAYLKRRYDETYVHLQGKGCLIGQPLHKPTGL
jgi:hypothetical protein